MSDFDKIFNIVRCNRLAKELLDKGLTVERVEYLYGHRGVVNYEG